MSRGIDPHPGIPHAEAEQPGRLARDAHLDLAVLGERDRVRDQVGDHLAQPARIAAQRARHVGVELTRELEPLLLGANHERPQRIADHVVEIEGHVLQLDLAGFDARVVENVVHDREQCAAGVDHRAQVIALFLRELGVEQDLREPDHGVERRPDLVAHVGQELALRAVRGLRRIARHAELAGLLLEHALGQLARPDLGAQRLVRRRELLRARQLERSPQQGPERHAVPIAATAVIAFTIASPP